MIGTATDTRDARLTDFLEGQLSAEDAELQELLGADAALKEAFEDARIARSLLTELRPEPTPQHFLRKVQRKIRRRSGGRYFHPVNTGVTYTVTIEAFVVIAVVIMAACWFFLETGRLQPPSTLVEVPAIEGTLTP